MRRSNTFYPGIIVYTLALIVRGLYNITGAKGYYPSHDAAKYQAIALNMLHNHCYCLSPRTPTLDRAPLWPTMIAIIYGILGQHDLFVRLFLCTIGAGTCVFVYFFSRDLFGERVGIVTGCVAALYPFLFIYDGWLYSESLYTFLLFALCYMLYRLQRVTTIYGMLAIGFLLNLIALTRPNGILIFGAFLVWSLVMGCTKLLTWRNILKCVLLASLLFMFIVFPWTVRNYMITGRSVLIATGDGTVLLGAYNDKVVGTWYENGYYQGTWVAPEEAVPEITKYFSPPCQNICAVKQDDAFRHYAWDTRTHEGHTLSTRSALYEPLANNIKRGRFANQCLSFTYLVTYHHSHDDNYYPYRVYLSSIWSICNAQILA